jgi:alkylation response protein AidB-like acyl-CoA dehydrogenase
VTVDLSAALDPVLKAARADAADVDASGRFPAVAVEALRGSGLLGLPVPVEVGGLGAGPVEFAEVVSALAAECGSTAMVYLMHVSAAMSVVASPPPDLPDLLPGLADGRLLGTLAFSERGSRSHFWAPVSRAEASRDPAGASMRIQAQKSFVTSAGHADFYVLSTLSPAGGPSDVDLYVLPRGTPGLQVAGRWRGMGLRGNDSAPMAVDIQVPAGQRIGAAGAGLDIMIGTVLPWFNLGNAAVSIGLASAAVDAAVAHATTARFEQTGQSLAELPTIRARLARMALGVAIHRSYLQTAAAAIAAPDEGTVLHVLGVKAAANDAALTITDEAMRVCGGAAFSAHLPLERYFRDARAGHVMAPTADALYDFYGKAMTGQPLF